jgi:glycosyltransferase involved in cell wall biosynthesis
MSPLPNSARPLISVLLPVLNPHPEYFRQAVGSILSQTLSDLELLIVEDPSPRQAAPLLAEYSDSRIRHVSNAARTGLVQQLNQGLAEARGEVVARMDADDVAEPDRLLKQYELLRREQEVAVTGSQLRIIDGLGRHRGYRPYPLTHEAILAAMPRFNPLAHPSVMFRRDVVKNAGGYQYQLHNEDYELWSRLAVSGRRFANHPEPLLRYRIHAGSVKATRLRMMIRGTLQVKDRYWREHMRLGDRLRLLGERCLLALPAGLVMEVFKRTAYRPSLAATRSTQTGDHRPAAVGDP